MRKAAVLAVLCSLSLSACLAPGADSNRKAPRLSEGRMTMAKIGGRPLPVFEFNARVAEEDNKIVKATVHFSTEGEMYKEGSDGAELTNAKSLDGEYVRNVHQVRATVDPAKDEALASYLNSPESKVAFQWEVEWSAPESEETTKTRSPIYVTDNKNIASAGLAREIPAKQ